MRLRWALAAGIIAIALVVTGKLLWDCQQQASLQRVKYAEEQRLVRALDQRVKLPFSGSTSVQSWLDEFTRQTGQSPGVLHPRAFSIMNWCRRLEPLPVN